jgi:heme a synthase
MSTSNPARDAATAAEWRNDIPPARRRPLRIWLWSIAAMTFTVLIVGGITRLTQSGLSIVDWRPLMGVIPPLNEAQWQAAFDQYRQFPEYQLLRRGMTLDEFQFIFFWEYLHRLVARAIGLVFLVPFVVFWARGYFTRAFARRALVLFALGAMQGVLGWIMVRSGLVERPSVSHFRLAAHLSLAFVIFGYAVWLARELRGDGTARAADALVALGGGARRLMMRGLAVIGALLAVQIVWGAFVAGLRAGKFYNTFPLMGGGLIPPNFLAIDPLLRNFVSNPITVQWTHRLLGTVLAVAAVWFFVRVQRAGVDATSRRLNLLLAAGILVQYLLGVLTLLFFVPVSLGVIHQGAAMVLFGVWLWWVHHVHRSTVADAAPDRTAAYEPPGLQPAAAAEG